MSRIIDGTAIARAVRAEVQQEVAMFQQEFGAVPGLATVLVGENPASASYVRSKHKACAETGIASEGHTLPAETTQARLLALVESLNRRTEISGILVQLPLPPHLDADAIIDAIEFQCTANTSCVCPNRTVDQGALISFA